MLDEILHPIILPIIYNIQNLTKKLLSNDTAVECLKIFSSFLTMIFFLWLMFQFNCHSFEIREINYFDEKCYNLTSNNYLNLNLDSSVTFYQILDNINKDLMKDYLSTLDNSVGLFIETYNGKQICEDIGTFYFGISISTAFCFLAVSIAIFVSCILPGIVWLLNKFYKFTDDDYKTIKSKLRKK